MSRVAGPVDERSLLERALSLLPEERRNYSTGVRHLAVSVACGPAQSILRPSQIEERSLAEHLAQSALFGPARILDRREDNMEHQAALAPRMAAAREGLSAGEAAALELLRQGERKTAPYAAVLGITDLPEAEQRQQVKRVKDKLKKRLERAGGPHV